MNYTNITDPEVQAAIQAWQEGDPEAFLSYFSPNALMTDDGNIRSLPAFVKEACGNELFLSLDKVEDEGRSVFGNFKAGHWGTFRVYFKFHKNPTGKFDRLDIGQAKY